MGPQAMCKVKVDHVGGPAYFMDSLRVVGRVGKPHHGNIICLGTNGKLLACHNP